MVKIAGTVLIKLAVTFKSHTTMIKLALTLSILDFFFYFDLNGIITFIAWLAFQRARATLMS